MFLPPDAEKCVIDLENNAKLAEKNPRLIMLGQFYTLVAQMLRYSVKIVVPDNGEVYRDNNAGGCVPSSDESKSLIGLPAPTTSLVYRWTRFDKNEKPDGECYAPKRITLVLDGKQIMSDYDPSHNTGMMIYSLFYAENLGKWDMCPVAFGFDEPYDFQMIPKEKVILDGYPYADYCWNWGGPALDLITGKPITQQQIYTVDYIKNAYKEIKCDVNAVVQCMHSLRAGASLKEQRHQSASRRKKMERKGVGGFTYHILEVPNGGSKSSRQGGTHASPRLHVRRAHIRKLPTGALTFVRQCFVGDKSRGIVVKDYQVRQQA